MSEELNTTATAEETPEPATPETGAQPTGPEPEPQAARVEAEAQEEKEEAGEDFSELPDDVLQAIADLYGDKLADHPKVKEKLEQEFRRRALEEERRQRVLQAREQQLQQAVQTGREAVERLQAYIDSHRKALEKAISGEAVEENLPQEDIGQLLGAFGTAVYVDASSLFESAFAQAFTDIAASAVTPEDIQAIAEATASAQALEQQDPDRALEARARIFSSALNVLAKRMYERGKEEGRKEALSRRKAIEKVTETNALAAALARLSGKAAPPSSPPGSKPQTASVVDFAKEYEEAKRSGNVARAEEILSMWAQSRARGEA